VLLEINGVDSVVRKAGVRHLADIRVFRCELGASAGIADAFARQWHFLMKGSIVAANEDDLEAARRAKEIGHLLLRRHGVVP
jgi:hypothetical protein